MEPIKFGKYLLVKLTASGGMAEIYKALAKTQDGRVHPLAIKRILPQYSKDDEFISLMIDEAKIMVFLNHPNIVSIVEFGKVDATYYIAMEYVEGPTLQQLFRKAREKNRKIPIPIALFIVKEIATGLGYAHRKVDPEGKVMNLVHRDISPANILMSFEGDIKIADFGISKAANQNHHTQVGIIRGKTGYMSPEQTKAGKHIDGRSDLYSLGIILFELISGQRLFKAETVPEALKMVREGKIPSLGSYRTGLPVALEQLVDKSLMKDPALRYQTGDEFADAINEFLTKYATAKREPRITHNDLKKFIREFFPGEVSAAELNDQLQSSADKLESSTATTASQIFAANPLFDIEDGDHAEIEKAFKDEFSRISQPKSKQVTQSLKDAPQGRVLPNYKALFKLLPILGLFLGVFGLYKTGYFVSSSKRVDVEISSMPEGALIFINEVQWPQKTPALVQMVEGEKFKINLSKFGFFEHASELTAHKGMKPFIAELKMDPSSDLHKAKLYLTTEPPGATVSVEGVLQKEKTPLEIKVEMGKKISYEVNLPGYKKVSSVFDAVEPIRIEKNIYLLKNETPLAQAQGPAVAPLGRLGGKITEKAKAKKINLSVSTTPWSNVYVDGKKVGVSPFVGLSIESGKHKLKFENSMFIKKPFEINVLFDPKNEDVKCIYDLMTRSGSCK